jgi:hypothetical protein
MTAPSPKPTHTPGPWHISEGASVKAAWETHEVVQVATLSTTHWSTDPNYDDVELNLSRNKRMAQESKANGRLIAAAPEMLGKLKKIHQWLIRLAENAERQAATEGQFATLREAHLADAKNFRNTARDLDAVIAKAEGREP